MFRSWITFFKEEAHREITHLYGLRQQMLPCDREHLYENTEEHFEKDPTARGLRQWIKTWKPVLLRGINASKKRGLHGRQSTTCNIRDWLVNSQQTARENQSQQQENTNTSSHNSTTSESNNTTSNTSDHTAEHIRENKQEQSLS